MIELAKLENHENETLTLTAFGKLGANKTASTTLQTIDLKVISKAECDKVYKKYDAESQIIGAGHLCTFNKKSEGACGGDSGSPLTLENRLIAIVNAGIPCAEG